MASKKYPYNSNTVVIGLTYTIFYFFTYMFAAITYTLITEVPADQSRSISWLYGVVFTIIPNIGVLFIVHAISFQAHNNYVALVHSSSEGYPLFYGNAEVFLAFSFSWNILPFN
jgi:ammonia channel protein AmtB